MTAESDALRAARCLVERLRAVAAVQHPAEQVEVLETHISWVLLAGELAYKLKKPVDLGFLDFSTLARRHHFCQEELRLNRRLAPALYLDVVPVTGSADAPRFGGSGRALEYAVRMIRFPQQALLTNQRLTAGAIDKVIDRIARFHADLPPAAPDTPYGDPERVLAPMLQNFDAIRARGSRDTGTIRTVRRLEGWTLMRFDALRSALAERRRHGFIRECHGDLHRGNIAMPDGEPIIFDGIEFDPALRWIDTASELAFLLMDLLECGETRLARRSLNRYLEITGDYGALTVLRFYTVYRAMVRAKVIAIRLEQGHQPAAERSAASTELRRYLILARALTRATRPLLLITCGLSGSGKTWLGHRLREESDLIHLRSDIERKRLFGMRPTDRPASDALPMLYCENAGVRTYTRLGTLARTALEAGWSVLVDATFLTAAQRRPFAEIAAAVGCPFRILALDAPAAVLRARVSARAAEATDPSDAGLDVLERQIVARERLTPEERARAVMIDSSHPPDIAVLLRRLVAD